jgi:Phosphodiester glycosidase
VDTAEDGGKTTGPWVVHVLEVEPDAFAGRIVPELGTGVVPGLERLTGIAARTGALAAVNGGYFVIGPADGTPGDLAGVSVIDGMLLSEAVNGRTSLVLPAPSGDRAFVATLRTRQSVTAADGATRELDGLNRGPGLIRACGGSGGDVPTEAPKHDFTCTNASELVLYTSDGFGEDTPAGAGVEALLSGTRSVLSLREPRGGPIPVGGSVLAGTGDAENWLRDHALPTTALRVGLEVIGDHGALALADGLGVVNGGPRLLRDRKVALTAAGEGFHRPEQPEFYYRFGVTRNPRTLAGVAGDGTLVFVAVDGRQTGFSVGASFVESARIIKALGAVDALNLDGGGSTTMTVGSAVVNRPSDPAGERPIGDALVVVAR